MTDIKSRILEEAESAGINVIAIADAMEKCPTLKDIVDDAERGVVPLKLTRKPSFEDIDEDRLFKEAQGRLIKEFDDLLNLGEPLRDSDEIMVTVDVDSDGAKIEFESPKPIPARTLMVIKNGIIKPATKK